MVETLDSSAGPAATSVLTSHRCQPPLRQIFIAVSQPDAPPCVDSPSLRERTNSPTQSSTGSFGYPKNNEGSVTTMPFCKFHLTFDSMQPFPPGNGIQLQQGGSFETHWITTSPMITGTVRNYTTCQIDAVLPLAERRINRWGGNCMYMLLIRSQHHLFTLGAPIPAPIPEPREQSHKSKLTINMPTVTPSALPTCYVHNSPYPQLQTTKQKK